MTITEALSGDSISAMLDAVEIGEEKLGNEFYSASVKKMLKNGYKAIITDKAGNEYTLTVKVDYKFKIINFRKNPSRWG